MIELMDLDLAVNQNLTRKLFETGLQEACSFNSKSLLQNKTNLILNKSTFSFRGMCDMLGGEDEN